MSTWNIYHKDGSKQPFYFLITASVINIILDGILILGMGLGVEG